MTEASGVSFRGSWRPRNPGSLFGLSWKQGFLAALGMTADATLVAVGLRWMRRNARGGGPGAMRALEHPGAGVVADPKARETERGQNPALRGSRPRQHDETLDFSVERERGSAAPAAQ